MTHKNYICIRIFKIVIIWCRFQICSFVSSIHSLGLSTVACTVLNQCLYAVPGRICQQEHVLPLYGWVYKRWTCLHVYIKSLCWTCTCAILLHCAWTFLSIRACATPAWVCLQELFCCTWTCLHVYMYKGLCCTCSRVNVCFFVLHMHVRVCIQELFATPGRFCLAPGTPGFARSTHKLFGLFRKTTDWVEERAGKFKIACYSPFAFKKKTVNQETNNNCPLLAKEGLPAPIAVNEAHYQSCSWSSSATKPPQQPQAT